MVEVKVTHSWGSLRGPGGKGEYPRHVERDLAKIRSVAPQSRAIALLASIHIGAEIPEELRGVVKYSDQINRRIRKVGADQMRQLSHELLSVGLTELARSDALTLGSFSAGEAFGVCVEVDYWAIIR